MEKPDKIEVGQVWKWHCEYDPNCKCNEPLLISLPPGEKYYPCPVHKDRFVMGSNKITLNCIK